MFRRSLRSSAARRHRALMSMMLRGLPLRTQSAQVCQIHERLKELIWLNEEIQDL